MLVVAMVMSWLLLTMVLYGYILVNQGVLRSTISGASFSIECDCGMVDEETEMTYIACATRNKIVKPTWLESLISCKYKEFRTPIWFHWPMGLCQDTAGNI